MSISAAISRAALPDTHTVCGVTLRPYCIGHWLLMQRCSVSFITNAEEHGLGDLLVAVLICSDTFENFAGSLRRGSVERAMLQWQRRLSGGIIGYWKRRFKRWRGRIVEPDEVVGFNFREQCEAFHRYLDDHGGGLFRVNDWSVPATKGKQSARDVRCPDLLVLFDALTSELGLTETEAMNAPLPWARWRWAMHAERKDWLQLLAPEDVQRMKDDKKRADEFAASIPPEQWAKPERN